ncbi:hypothetical protein MIMGU_mgv1a018143mg, partial [Erythranthe guttata]
RNVLSNGILYTSNESYYYIFKGSIIYRIECQIIGTLITGEIDCTDLKEKLFFNKDKPAIINLNIGTIIYIYIYECGFSHDRFYIHCDAASYGLVSPFLENGPLFSFKKPIGSVSVSAHKLLGSSMPCGVLISRKMHMTDFSTNIEYIATLDTTIRKSKCSHANLYMLRFKLEMSHWTSKRRKMAHVVLMPHVTMKMFDDFLCDLVRKREIWYGSGEVQPVCLAEKIGASNCASSIHGNYSINGIYIQMDIKIKLCQFGV